MTKKKYEKPRIYLESFELAQNIAACNLGAKHSDGNQCAYLDQETGTKFFSNVSICDWYGPGVNDLVCYHVPTNNNVIFSS